MSNSKRLAVLVAALCVVTVGIWTGTRGRPGTSQVATATSSAAAVNSAENDQTEKPPEETTEAPAESKPEKAEAPSEEAPEKPAPEGTSDKPAAGDKKAGKTIDIDSGDPKYLAELKPEIIANGKPVTVLYRPPHMFSVALKAVGDKEKRGELTLATMTVESERGREVEVHILLRDKSAKITPIARLRAGTTQKGRAWTKRVSGLRVRVKVLDHGSSPESPFAGSPLCWVKFQVTATTAVPAATKQEPV